MCINFEIILFYFIVFAAFAYTRIWFVGLFKEQAQG
jgi:hypothetical protein